MTNTEKLAQRIYRGLKAGGGFATVRDLLKQHGYGGHVSEALDLLSDQRKVMRVRGVGAYVEII